MKQPLSTPNAMEKSSTFAASTADRSFCPRQPVPDLSPSREAAVDDKVANEGAEDIYKIYVESFRNKAHPQSISQEAQRIVDTAVADT